MGARSYSNRAHPAGLVCRANRGARALFEIGPKRSRGARPKELDETNPLAATPPEGFVSTAERLRPLDRRRHVDRHRSGRRTGTMTTAFHPNQIRLLDGVVEGLKALVAGGYGLGIVTNQPAPPRDIFQPRCSDQDERCAGRNACRRGNSHRQCAGVCIIPTAEWAAIVARRPLRMS